MAVIARDVAPGEHVTAQQIADEASVHRTGLYRYFEDRADLDTAIQAAICSDLQEKMLASLALEGTVHDVVTRIVFCYVQWVADHPAWTRFIARDVADAKRFPLDEVIDELTDRLELGVAAFLTLVQADLTADEHSLIGPWVASLVAGCRGAVWNWAAQPQRIPSLESFATFLADTIWLQITGLVASKGIAVPRDPIEQLFESGLPQPERP